MRRGRFWHSREGTPDPGPGTGAGMVPALVPSLVLPWPVAALAPRRQL